MAAAALLNFENVLPFLYYWTTKFDGNVENLIKNATVTIKMHIYQKSRWRLPPSWPPSWISNRCGHFCTTGPILTKFDGNVENLTKNAIVTFKMYIYQNSRWQPPTSWISKRCGHFNTIKPFLTKHVVNTKYRPAGRKTANINVKNYISLNRGVYRPDSTYKTAKMIYQKYSH